MSEFDRTQMLIGEKALEKLAASRTAVFGIGGVGGYVCEALARCGVGHFDLIDNDTVSITNLNRQIIALHSTIGRHKTEVMKERILDINPCADVVIHNCFFLPENAGEFDFTKYDYVVDAVDTVTAKLSIIIKAKEAGVPVISAMGAGNKMDPGRFEAADIYKTSVCPLAKVMRRELKKRGVDHLKVVYSREEPMICRKLPEAEEAERRELLDSQRDSGQKALFKASEEAESEFLNQGNDSRTEITTKHKKTTPGSIMFAPAAAGIMIASEVVKDLINKSE